ncbi:MAG: AEC family transporter [Clostridia bacterium]|nr:AEC family transporter [Clostridia bacterium]
MEAFFTMLSNVLIFIALAVPGFIMAKTNVIKESESQPLSRILIYIGVPFLVASNALQITFDSATLIIIALSALISVLYTAVWYVLSKPATSFIKDFKTQGVARFEIWSSNNGFLGIPLAVAVFSNMPLVIMCVVIANIINNVAMFTIGVYLISGDKKNISIKKIITNPCLIGFVVGIILNFTKVTAVVPQISDYINYLTPIVTPISMFVLGIKLGSIKIASLFKNKYLYVVSLYKLIFVPTLLVGVMLLLGLVLHVPNELILGMFVAFATPSASMATTFADNYGGDSKSAAIFTIGTTILSVITIPVLYYLLMLII